MKPLSRRNTRRDSLSRKRLCGKSSSLTPPTTTTALMATVPPADLQPGDQLDDFDLLAKLGKGAFATVFLGPAAIVAANGRGQDFVAIREASRRRWPNSTIPISCASTTNACSQSEISGCCT